MKRKQKEEKRSKESIRQRQEEACHITVIRDGKIIVRDGKPIKK